MKPTERLLDGKPYTPSHQTDIRKLFERLGFVPPSQRRNDGRLVAGATTGTATMGERA